MLLEILTYPNPELLKVSAPVTSFDQNLHTLLDNMSETMYEANGIGLAAPQVGQKIRAFIVDIATEEDDEKRLYEFVNPVISEGSGSITFEEGCLSVPGFSEEVKRKEHIRVDFYDRFGKPQILEASGLLAVAIQHENDHLDGVLFVDRLSPIRKRMAKKKLSKAVTL
ncbi:peptide deformylase [bacterium]|nr:peptide deformylase [bacterium]